jgi:alpha-beta hydrolase superfamily lysophospholipase
MATKLIPGSTLELELRDCAAASHLWQTDVQPASNHKMPVAVVQPEEDY